MELKNLKVIITAGGLGSRFTKIGINVPKYKINVKDKNLFYMSIDSLRDFFDYEFIFIFLKPTYDEKFVSNEIEKLGIKKYKIILLDELTDGQASSLYVATKNLDKNDKILIYNIDTHIDNKYIKQSDLLDCDGLWYVFNGEGEHWSFMQVNENGNAIKVTEKVKISDLCSIGLYYFSNCGDFNNIYLNYKEEVKKNYKEAYVAPFYQYLINQNKIIKYKLIPNDKIIPLGTPSEVENFDKDWLKRN